MPSKLLIMDITFEYYLSSLLYTFCFRKVGRRKRQRQMTPHMAWHVIEFHRVAFLEALSFKSSRFSIAEMKYALLTSFPPFHSHKDNCTSP